MDLHFEDHDNQSLQRFEKMLHTNNVYFFDTVDIEQIIKYYMDNGKIVLAKKALALGLQQHPQSVVLKLLKAELYIFEDNYSEALQLLDEVAVLEPHNEEVYIQRALLLSKQEKHIQAIDLLLKSLELTSEDNIDVLSLIGMEYMFIDDFEHAMYFFKKCIQIDPEDATSLYNIVYCYDMLGNDTDAIGFLKAYIDEHPFSETAWHQIGLQYTKVENHIEALKAFDYALLIDEQFVGAYLEKAKVLEDLGRYREAIQNYLHTIELDDPTAFVYFKIGRNYEALKNLSEAITYYLKSNEQDPFLDKPLIALTNLYYGIDDYQSAMDYINKLIDINDEVSEYWRLYGQINMKTAFFEEAISAFNKCIALGGESLEIYLAIADAYYFIGDYKEVLKVLLQAEVFYHNQVEIEFRLSGIYFLITDIVSGERHLRKALQLNPVKFPVFKSLFPVVYNSRKFQRILNRIRSNY